MNQEPGDSWGAGGGEIRAEPMITITYLYPRNLYPKP